jgi:uncharacterized protein (UPF0212 family)
MAKCPKCGTVVNTPKKKWTMAGRPDKTGKRMQLEIGLFDCPKCKKPFREVLEQKESLKQLKTPATLTCLRLKQENTYALNVELK